MSAGFLLNLIYNLLFVLLLPATIVHQYIKQYQNFAGWEIVSTGYFMVCLIKITKPN